MQDPARDPRMYLYILDGHTPVPVTDTLAWARWFETADRIVKQEEYGNYRISTVFLGIDHGFGPHPLLFETMVFARFRTDPNDLRMERCSTWQDAEAQHERLAREFRRAAVG